MSNNHFIHLIQISLGAVDGFDEALSDQEWEEMFALAKKHSILGVLFEGLMRLPAEQRPPRLVYLKWASVIDKIESRNALQDRRTEELSRLFSEAGFENCILKGQGAARRYPKPEWRQCGDIDIWVQGRREDIIKFVRSKCSCGEVVYHHVGARFFQDVPTEVHFTPTWMNSPLRNRRLQAFFDTQAPKQFSNIVEGKEFNAPTAEFDAVFMLVHIYRHLFSEGVGLRQLFDYYWTLLALSPQGRATASGQLRTLGLRRIAASVMYVLQKVFALPEEMMLAAPDRKDGEFLLNEILISGNFGKGDNRTSTINSGNVLQRFLKKYRFQLRLLRHYPGEVLWAPFFKTWQYLWRKSKGYMKQNK